MSIARTTRTTPTGSASHWLVGHTTTLRTNEYRLPGAPAVNPEALARGRARRRLEDLQIERDLGLR
jgi:hypothetical protein